MKRFLIVGALLLSACSPYWKAKWTAAGIDTAKCLAPDVIDSASDAITALLSQSQGNNIDFKSLGISLASKYGSQAALCAIGKIYNDLGGPNLARSHAQPVRALLAADWLLHHQSEWLNK